MTDERKLTELRRKAEAELNLKIQKSELETNETAHELTVHKIELELQNDELLKTQEQLSKSKEEYVNLFNAAPVVYFILDENGVVLNANHAAEEKFGVEKKAMLNKHLSIFLGQKECQDNFYRHLQEVLETGIKGRVECQLYTKTGNVSYILFETVLVNNIENHFKKVLTVITDVTDQKERTLRLEALLKKEKELNELKSQFITIASHEFRTPLTTILSSTELLSKYSKPEDDPKRLPHYRKIYTAVHRLKEILMDFMSAEKISLEKTINNPVEFDLKLFIEKLMEEVKPFNGTHLVSYEHSGNDTMVYLDKTLLRTCMFNLMVNAYKYTGDGGKIDVRSNITENNIVEVSVKDTGLGIPEGDQHLIFEPFFRAQNVGNISGTGIGLNITKEMVSVMGGTISFESKEQVGTTFCITLPQKRIS